MLRQVTQFRALVGLALATLALGLQIDHRRCVSLSVLRQQLQLLGVHLFAGAPVAHAPQVRQLQIEFVDGQVCRLERAALPLNRFGQRVDLGLQHIRCHEA